AFTFGWCPKARHGAPARIGSHGAVAVVIVFAATSDDEATGPLVARKANTPVQVSVVVTACDVKTVATVAKSLLHQAADFGRQTVGRDDRIAPMPSPRQSV